MPLLDHFHPPLSAGRHWESFHARWAASIADALNESLPEGYFAETQVHLGPRVEIDVASFQDVGAAGGTAVATQARATLAPPDVLLPMVFPPEWGVQVFDTSGGPTLVAAVELVSPRNKDRPESRGAFAAKCATYLHGGVGLIVIDVVTTRHGRPLHDLFALLFPTRPVPEAGPLAAAAYAPIRRGGVDSLEVRVRGLAVGRALPELPLSLGAAGAVGLDLEAAYEDARGRSRLGVV